MILSRLQIANRGDGSFVSKVRWIARIMDDQAPVIKKLTIRRQVAGNSVLLMMKPGRGIVGF